MLKKALKQLTSSTGRHTIAHGQLSRGAGMKEVAKSEVIVGQLQQVFDSDQSRTKMGRLREMFDAIEQKRDGGMSLENIRSVLKKTTS